MSDINFKETISFAKEQWQSVTGLIVGIIIFGVFYKLIIPTEIPTIYWITGLSIGILIIAIIWHFGRRIPRTPKYKIGFVISIYSSTESERKKVKEDFIFTLRELMKSGKTGKTIHFIIIPDYKAKNIKDEESALNLRIKCRAHFIIYGRVRKRILDGESRHVLRLEAGVAHKPIPEPISKKLSNEFGELMPRRVQFSEANDMLFFELTSEWIEIVSKYIIGIAAFVSLDIDYAEQLFKEVEKKLDYKPLKFPVAKKIRDRIPHRYIEIYLTRAEIFYNLWLETRDKTFIDEMGENLLKIESPEIELYKLRLLKSIYYFLAHRDTVSAKRELKKCKKIGDGTWNMNLAFLLAYEGDLKASTQQYWKAANSEIEANALSQIEDFICWFLTEEPDKIQLHFCLGYFNWKVKGDYKTAIRDFERFVQKDVENSFAEQKNLAIKWIQELEEELKKADFDKKF